MWRISFKNIGGESCHIDIYRGKNDTGSEIVHLTPSTTPFRVKYDDDDNIFTPVRTSTGNIGIIIGHIDENGNLIDDTNLLNEIIASNPLDRPVRVYSGGWLVWEGFIKAEMPEHKLWEVGETVNIPVMSMLEVLNNIHVQLNDGLDQTISMGRMIHEAVSKTGFEPNCYFSEESIKYNAVSSTSILNKKLNKLNYIEMLSADQYKTGSDGKVVWYKGKSYMEVLEDLCLRNNLYLMEVNTALYFVTVNRNKDVTYHYFHFADLATDHGRTSYNVYGGKSIRDYTITTDKHNISLVAGKGKITFTAKRNKLEHIFELKDVDDYIKKDLTHDLSTVWFGDEKRTVECHLPDTPFVEGNGTGVSASGCVLGTIKFNPQAAVSGGFIEQEGTVSDVIYDGSDLVEYSGNVETCLLFVHGGSVTIKPQVLANGLNSQRMVMSFDYKQRTNIDGEWTTDSMEAEPFVVDGINPRFVHFDNGKAKIGLPTTYKGGPITLRVIGYTIPLLYRVSNLQIKYDNVDYNYGALSSDSDTDNIYTETIDNGFSEELSLECGLTKRGGYGTSDFDSYWTDEAIMSKAKNYYSKARNRIEVTLRLAQFLEPYRTYIYNNVFYSIVSMEMDAYNKQVKLILQEITA